MYPQFMVPHLTRILRFSIVFLLLIASAGKLLAQTPLLTDPGRVYLDTDGVVSDNYGAVDISNCSSVAFTFNWEFTVPWEGPGNMEPADECGACAGDPTTPTSPGCDNCWDFLQIDFLINGAVVSTELIGEAGTTDAEQSGSFSEVFCTDGQTDLTASIQAQSQCWGVEEGVTYSNISIVCYEGLPTATANPDPLCSTEALSLDGVVSDDGVIATSNWIGPGTIDDPSQLRTSVQNVPAPTATYTLEVTDVNNCTASVDVDVDVVELTANSSDAIVICIDAPARSFELLNQMEVEDQIRGGDPSLTISFYFDAAGTDPIDLTDPASAQRLFMTMQTTIFATVSDGTCESATVPVDIDALQVPEPQREIYVGCADEFGFAAFDLDFISSRWTDTNPGWTISFHPTEEDALDDLNPLTGTLTEDRNQTLFVRATLGNGCAGVGELRLRAEAPPVAAPALLSRCDEGGQQASFDLNEASADINVDDIGYVVFYDSPSGSIADEISDPSAYTTASTTIYARVLSDNDCPSELVEVELIVVSLDASQFSLEVTPETSCGSGELELVVNGPGLPPGDFWYNISYGPESAFPLRTETLPAASGAVVLEVEAFETYLFTLNSVTSPSPSSCPLFFGNTPIAIATINQGPPAYDASLRACEFEFNQGLFDLTSLEDTIVRGQDYIEVRFFEDEFLENQIPDPENYQSFPGLIYASFEDPSGCFSQAAEIELIVDLVPEPVDFALDITENCGPTEVNLSFTLPPSQPLDYNFTLTTPSGSRDTTLENIRQDSLIAIFVNDTTTFTLMSVTNLNGCTFGFQMEPADTVNIRPNELIAMPTNLELCDESADGSLQATFNLMLVENIIQNGTTAPVRWYEDPATSQAITNLLSYSATNGTRIYAVLDGPCPSLPVAVDLVVHAKPDLSINLEQGISCASATDAILQATVVGDATPFTFDWSNDAWDGQSRVTGVGPGSYQLLLSDENGCQDNANITLTPPPALDLSCSVLANVSLVGATDGQAGYTLDGGTPPYTYQLTGPTPQTGTQATIGSFTLDNLAAGDFTLTITDSQGCQTTCNFTITDPNCNLSLSIVGTSLSCNGAGNGAINLTINSAFAITNIDWNVDTYDGTEDPQNLPAGSYSVRVTDANGCMANTSINISEPPSLSLDCSNTIDASALGLADGSMMPAISGGNAPYTLDWAGPVSGSRTNDPDGSAPISSLSAGSYTLNVTDANACTITCQFTINEPGCDLSLSCTPNGVGEAEGPGSYTYTISGGTPPYRMERTGPSLEVIDPLNSAGSQSTGLLPAGDYEISITDVNGCTANCQFTIAACTLSASLDADDPSCPGATDGMIEVVLDGGTAPYTFDWSDDQYDSMGSMSTLANLPAANYALTVTDAAGCEATTSLVLVDPSLYETSCSGSITPSSPTATDGEITVIIATGPGGPYTISYDNGMGGSGSQLATIGTNTLAGLGNGTYTITISNTASCIETCQVDLFFVACTFDITSSQSDESCAGSADGVIMVESATGMPPYIYTWSDGGGGSIRTGLAPGNYGLTVTDANTCAAITNFTVDPGRELPSFSVGPGATLCPDACYELPLSFTGSPGFFLTYEWILPGQRIPADFSTNETTTTLTICPADEAVPAGEFMLVFNSLSDDRCAQDLTDTVRFAYRAPAVADVSPLRCPDEDYRVGTEVFDMTRPRGQVILPGAAQSGCDSIVNVSLSFYEPVSTDINPQICSGGSVQVGSITFDETNPRGSVTFSTVNGCDSVVNVSLEVVDLVTTELAPVLCPGETLMVGDSVLNTPGMYAINFPGGSTAGCDSLVNVNLSYAVPAESNVEPRLCLGDSFTLAGEVFDLTRPSGSVLLAGASSLGCDSLVNVSLTFHTSDTTSLQPRLCVGESFSLGVETFDIDRPSGLVTLPNATTNACDSLIQVDLAFYPVDTTMMEPLLCLGESLTIGSQTFDESRPDGLVVLSGATANGCDSLVEVALSFRPQPVGNLDTVLCAGESLQIGGMRFDEANPSGQVLLAGASAAGCDSLLNVSTAYVTELTVSMPADTVLCGDDPTSIIINLSAGGNYDLTFSRNGGTVIETGVTPPRFDFDLGVINQSETITLLSASSSNNCPVSILDEETVISFSDTQLRLRSIGGANGADLSCADSQDGAIAVEVQGGIGPYTYRWDNGQDTPVIENLGAGTYELSVTDQSGCTVSEALSLQAPLPIVAELSAEAPACFGEATGLLRIDTILGGTPPYHYQLNGGGASELRGLPLSFSNLSSGGYALQVSDANGCHFSETVALPEGRQLVLVLAQDTTIKLGDSILLDPLLNFDPQSIQWSPEGGLSTDSILRPVASPSRSVEYVLNLVDELGCTISDTLLITVNRDIPIYVPSAFSPNDDGRNDKFIIFGSNAVEEIESLQIFDRWGTLVFESYGFRTNEELAGWDGTHRGEPLNAAVFVYQVRFRLVDGDALEQAGEVLLMR